MNELDVRDYRNKGYAFPFEILSTDEATELRNRLETFESDQGCPLLPEQRNKMHLVFTWLDELIRHPKILAALQPVLGNDILCWSSSFFIKEPHDPAFISWHQDATYWGLSEPDSITTVWVALSASTIESGCMKVVPESHRRAQVPHRETYGENNLLSRGQEIAVSVDETEAVPVILSPGQASMHHVLIFHGSEPNRSDDRRIGIAIRYLPTRVRQLGEQRDCASLVSGKDDYGHFDREPRPDFDASPTAWAAHRHSLAQVNRILYKGAAKTM